MYLWRKTVLAIIIFMIQGILPALWLRAFGPDIRNSFKHFCLQAWSDDTSYEPDIWKQHIASVFGVNGEFT